MPTTKPRVAMGVVVALVFAGVVSSLGGSPHTGSSSQPHPTVKPSSSATVHHAKDDDDEQEITVSAFWEAEPVIEAEGKHFGPYIDIKVRIDGKDRFKAHPSINNHASPIVIKRYNGENIRLWQWHQNFPRRGHGKPKVVVEVTAHDELFPQHGKLIVGCRILIDGKPVKQPDGEGPPSYAILLGPSFIACHNPPYTH